MLAYTKGAERVTIFLQGLATSHYEKAFPYNRRLYYRLHEPGNDVSSEI
jgi:hypothetical protein